MYKVVFLGDHALGMRNLHAMGAFRYWQHPCSISSPLNSSCGRVENGKVAFPLLETPLFCFGSAQQFEQPRRERQGGLLGHKHTRPVVEDPSSRHHLGFRTGKPT